MVDVIASIVLDLFFVRYHDDIRNLIIIIVVSPQLVEFEFCFINRVLVIAMMNRAVDTCKTKW